MQEEGKQRKQEEEKEKEVEKAEEQRSTARGRGGWEQNKVRDQALWRRDLEQSKIPQDVLVRAIERLLEAVPQSIPAKNSERHPQNNSP